MLSGISEDQGSGWLGTEHPSSARVSLPVPDSWPPGADAAVAGSTARTPWTHAP